jgi:hypothetical protein
VLTSLLETPLGRRAREWTHFWCFKAINPKFDPILGNRLRSDISLCHLSDLIEVAKSVPGPILDTFYHSLLIRLGPPDSTCHFGTIVDFQAWKWAPDFLIFKLRCVHWIEHVLSFNLSQKPASKSKNWLQTVIFRDCVVHQILLKHHLPYLLLPFSGPPPAPMAFWDIHVTTYSRGMIPSFLDSLCMICAPSRQFC